MDPAQIAGAVNSNAVTVKADWETFGDVLLH